MCIILSKMLDDIRYIIDLAKVIINVIIGKPMTNRFKP